jgi:hypothetical protein
MQLSIVEPPIPAAHREGVERADVELALLPFLGDPAVLGVGGGPGIYEAREEQGAAVRPPRREAGTRGQ